MYPPGIGEVKGEANTAAAAYMLTASSSASLALLE